MTISEIRNIHPLVAELVCQRIREKGNEPDESKPISHQFRFKSTPEDRLPWFEVNRGNFEPLFSLYPELRGEGKPILILTANGDAPNVVINEVEALKKLLVEKEERIQELEEQNLKMKEAIMWACGYTDFGVNQKYDSPRYWWRSHLVKRAGLSSEELSALSNKPTKH